MTDENKHYIRRRNAGALPWEIEPDAHVEHPVFAASESLQAVPEGARVKPLPEDFAPTREILEFLQVHQGVPLEFIATALIDFKLYWHETGEARKAWQNKFKSHVIYQWKRNQSETGQRSHRSTVEKLTDRSWAEGLQFDDDWD